MIFSNFWLCLLLGVAGPSLCYEDLFYDASSLMEHTWRLSEASNQFGFKLLTHLANRKPKNVVFSPISVSTTFGLIYFGSRGATAKELEHILGYKELNITRSAASRAFRNLLNKYLITVEPRAYVLDLANALFVNDHLGLSSTYKTEAKEFFQSPVEAVNFATDGMQAVGRINEWVRNKTRDKICRIVDYIDPSVDLVAVNALYFKSKWTYSFADMNTRDGVFYNGGKVATTVPMMEQDGTFMYYEDDELSVVNLGFWGRNMSMFIILPHQRDGLVEVEKSVTHDKLNHYLVTGFPRLLQLTMPKFNLSYSSDLGPSLQAMGARQIFQPSLANLTGMVEEERVAVGEVRHKAVIDVNEAGVEASGVTATLSFKSMPLPEGFAHRFVVDHPFLFLILDERTDLVILMGRVWNL